MFRLDAKDDLNKNKDPSHFLQTAHRPELQGMNEAVKTHKRQDEKNTNPGKTSSININEDYGWSQE